LFTLPWLLFVADSGTVECAIAFFSSLYTFCHLADLRFSLFLLSFSHQARVLRPFPRTSTRRLRPAPRPHRTPSALKQKFPSVRRGFRGGSQASALRQQEDIAEDLAAVALVAAKKKWTILPCHHVGDIGKQLTMERQQLFTLKATTEPDDALATLKSSQHFGELQTMEKRTVYLFRLERWNTLSLSDSMATGSFSCLHGNPLLRAWRQPSTVGLSVGFGYCRGALTSLTMSGKLTMLADEWRTNGCIKPCCGAIKKSPTAVVNSAENWTHWRASDDGEL
jgi:hypothetical protein